MNNFEISIDDPVFKAITKEFVLHEKGYFILAPSGVGKTYYVTNQKEKHWIDGDYLWDITGADYLGDEWVYDFAEVQEVNKRCDKVTKLAKSVGIKRSVLYISNIVAYDNIVLCHLETLSKNMPQKATIMCMQEVSVNKRYF